MIIEISDEDIEKIDEFVEKSIVTHISHYRKRNQTDIQKIKNDIYNGKLAEFGVYYLYKDRMKITYPDINVYHTSKKSFDSDFIINDSIHLHVKSQHIMISKKFGLSWSFQKEDSLTYSPNENDWIIFVLVEDYNRIRIIKRCKASDLKNKYKEPLLERLKSIKKVIYYEDLKN